MQKEGGNHYCETSTIISAVTPQRGRQCIGDLTLSLRVMQRGLCLSITRRGRSAPRNYSAPFCARNRCCSARSLARTRGVSALRNRALWLRLALHVPRETGRSLQLQKTIELSPNITAELKVNLPWYPCNIGQNSFLS